MKHWNAIVTTFAVAALAVTLGWVGPALEDPPATADAKQYVSADMRKELAAAKLCRETHGESGYTWSVSGELVCIPRGVRK